ncbi:LOW QUALITY PROTEIN: carbohydrate sulfotransferase 11-like [Portunus trituberculatus]|uniref:LOW QUALITY PROTEIN: carbohydrate sulfotransferase 11-like n=1 Tax=Portunus trituberculatus TaxID=210409 RepID=UPI001E1CC3B6|nr:LOW QUALITY PROTEIN: carbohydrate sulfotransferase 11-like [Portunus trituberculatus]
MKQRRARVKEVCARHGLGPKAPPGTQKVKYPPTPNYETFYIDRGDRLAWCPVYKAASTSWLYGFLSLAGISESYMQNTKEQVSTVARRVWPAMPYDEAKEAMDMCVKVLVVRHPFERLASAFRDKLERVAGGEKHGTEHFYKKYGRKIVEKYRKKEAPGTNGERQPPPPPPPPPPPQRYSNALDDQPAPPVPPAQPPPRYKHILDDSPPVPPPQPPAQPPQRYRHAIEDPPSLQQSIEPTFPEFVRYLIDTDLTLYADDHWMPYHLSCTPCLLDFDVIAKFETLDRDQAYLLQKTHLQDRLKLSWRHLTKGNRTIDVVKKYFADVPKKHLLSLYGKYRLDFEMFDYSVADYLSYVKA